MFLVLCAKNLRTWLYHHRPLCRAVRRVGQSLFGGLGGRAERKGLSVVCRFSRQGLVYCQPAIDRTFSGFGEGPLQQFYLFATQGVFKARAIVGQLQQAFSFVAGWGDAVYQVHFHELAQRRIQRLLAYPQQREQFFHTQAGVAGNEKHDALVHATQASAFEHFVGLGGKGLIAKEEGFHGGLLRGLVFKVKHIDVSARVGVISVKQFDVFPPTFASGDLHGLLRTCIAPQKLLDP